MNHVSHILVVDDDSEIRQMLADYLQRNGLRVSQADGGRAMRALMDTHAVDLVVLDVMMPGEDGLSLCRNLRAGKHRAVPVVLLTARDDETDRIIGLEMGADDYVTKPFSSRELLARINAVIRRTQMLPPNLQVSEAASWLRRVAPGYHRPPPAGCTGHRVSAQRRRVPPVARVPRSRQSGAQPRPAAQPHPGP